MPGGSIVHRAVAKGVSRQIQGVLEQTQDQSQRVARTIALMAQATNMLADAYDTRVIQQLDDLQIAARGGAAIGCSDCSSSCREVAARVPGAGLDAWYSADAFNAHFRGAADDITEPLPRPRGALRRLRRRCSTSASVAASSSSCSRELGVDARGIEADPRLVEWAQSRGLAGRRRAARSST